MAADEETRVGKVSALVVTYNHEATIAEALDSVLAQEVDFPVEIIVADDCSTDGTVEVVRAYQQRYPERIKLLDSHKNVGITRNYQRGFAACSGEYIAVLEGDDYWLNADRLSTLTRFLDQHPECALVFNRILYLDTAAPSCRPLQWESSMPFETKTGAELAYTNFIGNFSACVYRTKLVRMLDDHIYDLRMYDWLFNLALSRFGLIGYIPRIMSVYRQHRQGTWSGLTLEKKLLETLSLIPVYDAFLNKVYSDQLNAHAQGIRMEIENIRLARLREKHRKNPFILSYILFKKFFRRLTRKLRTIFFQ